MVVAVGEDGGGKKLSNAYESKYKVKLAEGLNVSRSRILVVSLSLYIHQGVRRPRSKCMTDQS